MKLNPYLNFNGNCEEAMNFYKDCLGGEFESINYFREGPEEMMGEQVPEHFAGKIMHMTLRFGDNVLMASDSVGAVQPSAAVTLSIGSSDLEETELAFAKLSAGGEITMPLQDTFWGARFGSFIDKFGISWMFNCQ